MFNHYSKSLASRTHLNPDTQGEAIHVNMELSTTTRGKAKLLWNGYTKHTEKNDMIRWHCTCHASKLCPASAYTDLLPAYPVLKIDHNHCPEPMKLEVIFFKEICLYKIFIGFTKMPCYQNVGYQNVLLPKCQLPKRPLPKCPLPKCLDTLNWILF